jgi:serine/threonine protein kinase
MQPRLCDHDLIDRFLDDRLDTEELAAFENHLDSCVACRQELEDRAAGESWWLQARDCLSSSGSGSSLAPTNDGAPGGQPSSLDLAHDARSSLAAIKPYLSPTDDPRMMGRVGPYEVMGVVGSGGNGVVLKGFDAALNRYVAIKLLSPRLADSGAARRRFSREAQAAAAVVHDNVMAIHAVAETQGLPYLVMPYVRGPSLEKRLRSGGQLGLEEVLRVGMQVAAGLAAAHAQGLVHRDIKPANILLEEGVERVKITDFGLARAADDASLTRSGVIAGTPQYMSPEQARGEPVDHRTDLFSLGCVLYATCTGRSPFRAETSYGVLRKICESAPRPIRELNSALPIWMVRIIERLLAKDLSHRYASAGDVATLLERCLAHVQQPASVALPAELDSQASSGIAEWLSRTVRRPVVLATPGMVLLAVALLAWWQPSGDDRTTAEQPLGDVTDRPETVAATVWDDGINARLADLAADVERLRGECIDDLWNDSLDSEIDQLKRDLDDLGAQTTEPSLQRPTEN